MKAFATARHHFWGTYSATFVLYGAEDWNADAAERVLELARSAVPDAPWRVVQANGSDRCAVGAFVTSEQADMIEAWIDPLRVDEPCAMFDCKRKSAKRRVRHSVFGLEHSVDRGARAEIILPPVLQSERLPFNIARRIPRAPGVKP